MKTNRRFWLLSAPGCASSLVALVSALVALAALIALVRLVQQKPGTTTVNLPDANDLATEPIFEGTFDRPVDYSDPLLAQRKIVFATGINPHATREVVSKLLYLGRNGSTEPIDLYLRTNGGKFNDAFAIIDTMHLIKAPVNVWAVGGCRSAGTLILASATGKRIATRHAQIMVHASLENGDDPKNYSEDLTDKHRMEEVYKTRTHIPKEWYPFTGEKQYYIDAATAKKYGIIDEIR